jgi:GNAT superfamily N-acetyltransferase
MSKPEMKKASVHDVEIRLATRDDAATISEVLLESFSTFRDQYTPEAFEIVTPSAELIIERFAEGPMWVAIVDDKIVGTASVLPEPEWLYVRSMAVVPSARGMGIATKLLDVIEAYAIGERFEKLFLYTTYFSTGAVELYEKHGYIRGRDTTADEWYGTPGLAMEKNLKDVD